MRTEFLQQKLGEFIYILGEHNFNFIKPEIWEKHINQNEDFTEKQIQEFGDWVKSLKEDIKDEEEEVLKETAKTGFDAARELMKENGLKELKLGKFGIYRQYEMAGERVSFYLLDDIDMEEELWEKFESLLSFLDEDYIIDTLGYDEEGQNELWLTLEGLEVREFWI